MRTAQPSKPKPETGTDALLALLLCADRALGSPPSLAAGPMLPSEQKGPVWTVCQLLRPLPPSSEGALCLVSTLETSVHLKTTGQLFWGASVHLGLSDVSSGLAASLTGRLHEAPSTPPSGGNLPLTDNVPVHH